MVRWMLVGCEPLSVFSDTPWSWALGCTGVDTGIWRHIYREGETLRFTWREMVDSEECVLPLGIRPRVTDLSLIQISIPEGQINAIKSCHDH